MGVLSFGPTRDESDPQAVVGELRQLRGDLERMPKGRGKMFMALLALSDELIEWDRALHRWAKEHDARLSATVDALADEIRRRESER